LLYKIHFAEILQQRGEHVTNLVFMGMGEPMANYDEMIRAVKILTHPGGFGLGQRHITISTIGIKSGIEKLAEENLQIGLAISLHAPNNELRKKLVPTATSNSVEEIIEAGHNYFKKTGRRVTFEYVLMNGINDSPEIANDLAEANVDMVDESEVLTPADENHHIWKRDFTTPFVNGARSLAEALRRIEEGAAMIRTKGEPGTGNVAEAVLHIKKVNDELRTIKSIYDSDDKQGLVSIAREFKVSFDLVEETSKIVRLPVVNFAAGGIATPADAAYLMSLGCDGIFVGSGIF